VFFLRFPHLHLLIYLFTCLPIGTISFYYANVYLEIMQISVGRLRLCDLQANLICDICWDNFLHKNFEPSCVLLELFLHPEPSIPQSSRDFPLCVGPGLDPTIRLPQGTCVYMKQLNSTCIYVKLFALRRQLESKPTRLNSKWAKLQRMITGQ